MATTAHNPVHTYEPPIAARPVNTMPGDIIVITPSGTHETLAAGPEYVGADYYRLRFASGVRVRVHKDCLQTVIGQDPDITGERIDYVTRALRLLDAVAARGGYVPPEPPVLYYRCPTHTSWVDDFHPHIWVTDRAGRQALCQHSHDGGSR
jgi:hypothetical protein